MVSMAHIAQEFRPLTKCATSTRREKHLQRRQERCGCYRLPAQRLSTRTYLLQSDPFGAALGIGRTTAHHIFRTLRNRQIRYTS